MDAKLAQLPPSLRAILVKMRAAMIWLCLALLWMIDAGLAFHRHDLRQALTAAIVAACFLAAGLYFAAKRPRAKILIARQAGIVPVYTAIPATASTPISAERFDLRYSADAPGDNQLASGEQTEPLGHLQRKPLHRTFLVDMRIKKCGTERF